MATRKHTIHTQFIDQILMSRAFIELFKSDIENLIIAREYDDVKKCFLLIKDLKFYNSDKALYNLFQYFSCVDKKLYIHKNVICTYSYVGILIIVSFYRICKFQILPPFQS